MFFTPGKKKKQEIEAACKSDQMFNLTDNDFKVTIINMFKELKAIIIKKVKEDMMTSLHQIENINKDKDYRKHENSEDEKYN